VRHFTDNKSVYGKELLGCLAMAVYIIAADWFTKKEDPLLIGAAQMI